jgi:branched-chain amino acid transport system ATP-binding protein
MLTVKNLKSYYGTLQALHGVSLSVRPGEVVTLIGANGAGKSTIINSIAGILPQREGSIKIDETELIKKAPEKILRAGIALVPEGRQLFAPLSVYDNLLLGAYHRYSYKVRKTIQDDMEKVFGLFPKLKERRTQLAGTLSGGEQQMLAISRALMSNPEYLLLDEPSMGLAPIIVENIFEKVIELRKLGMTILVVEQNAKLALEVADRGYVVETGQIMIQGPSKELLNNPEVKRSYLGKGYKEVWD